MSNSTRPSSSNSYDERFVVPLEASRRGAHRARVSPIMAALPVTVVVGIVVGAVALVYLFLGGNGSDPGAEATASGGVSTVAPSMPSSQASGTVPSAAPASGAVDKTITLDVFNGTSPTVSGLARKAATKLTAAGWTTGKVETWAGTSVTQTTVFYGSSVQKPAAQAVVKVLGRGTVKLSAAKAGAGMAVVVGNDYPGTTGRTTGPTARSTGAAGSHSGSATTSDDAWPQQSRASQTKNPGNRTEPTLTANVGNG